MKHLHQNFLRRLNQLFGSIIALLGFSMCSTSQSINGNGEVMAMYGVPSAEYHIKGTVKNADTKQPVDSMRVVVQITDYESDIYTATLKNPNVPTLVGYSRDIEIINDSAVSMLSVESSVGVIPFDAKVENEKDLEKYSKDKINLAAVGTKTNEENKSSNVAVFGSRYMFYEDYLSTTSYNNANYIVNFCNTVTDRGDMGITINSATINTSELGITNTMSITIIGIIFILVIPVVILLMGLVVFIRRRTK